MPIPTVNEKNKENNVEKKNSLDLSLEDWILAFIEYAGGVVRGVTRLQKGLFLAWQEVGEVPTEFRPYKYGPYSSGIDRAIEKLIREKYISISEEPGGDESPVKVIRLTPKARERARRALEKLMAHPEWEKAIRPAFEVAANKPLIALLAYIYSFYPEWAKNSTIRPKVRKWRKRRLSRFF